MGKGHPGDLLLAHLGFGFGLRLGLGLRFGFGLDCRHLCGGLFLPGIRSLLGLHTCQRSDEHSLQVCLAGLTGLRFRRRSGSGSRFLIPDRLQNDLPLGRSGSLGPRLGCRLGHDLRNHRRRCSRLRCTVALLAALDGSLDGSLNGRHIHGLLGRLCGSGFRSRSRCRCRCRGRSGLRCRCGRRRCLGLRTPDGRLNGCLNGRHVHRLLLSGLGRCRGSALLTLLLQRIVDIGNQLIIPSHFDLSFWVISSILPKQAPLVNAQKESAAR